MLCLLLPGESEKQYQGVGTMGEGKIGGKVEKWKGV